MNGAKDARPAKGTMMEGNRSVTPFAGPRKAFSPSRDLSRTVQQCVQSGCA
ncbi:MAG TPA: hypothetical protein VN604_08930 [Nitrospirota bacterium]|nr:hypothetical protein [Nitrospirota bacterium]